MPKSLADKPPKYEYCEDHPRLLKKRFCCNHNILECSKCSVSEHDKCLVRSIGEVCKTVSSSETDLLFDSIKSLEGQVKSAQHSVEINSEKLGEQRDVIKKNMQSLYDNVISEVNRQFQEMLAETDTQYQYEASALFEQQQHIKYLTDKLKPFLRTAETFKGKPIDEKLFLHIQEYIRDANNITKELRDLTESMRFRSLSFMPSEFIEELSSSSTTFGTVSKLESELQAQKAISDVAFPHSSPPASQSISASAQKTTTPATHSVKMVEGGPPTISDSKFKATKIRASKFASYMKTKTDVG